MVNPASDVSQITDLQWHDAAVPSSSIALPLCAARNTQNIPALLPSADGEKKTQLNSAVMADTRPEQRPSNIFNMRRLLCSLPDAREQLLQHMDYHSYPQFKVAADEAQLDIPLADNPFREKDTLAALTAFRLTPEHLTPQQRNALTFFCEGGQEGLHHIIYELDYMTRAVMDCHLAHVMFKNFTLEHIAEKYLNIMKETDIACMDSFIEEAEKGCRFADDYNAAVSEKLQHHFTFSKTAMSFSESEPLVPSLQITIPFNAKKETFLHFLSKTESLLRISRQPEKIAVACAAGHMLKILSQQPDWFPKLSAEDKIQILQKGQFTLLDEIRKMLPEKEIKYQKTKFGNYYTLTNGRYINYLGEAL